MTPEEKAKALVLAFIHVPIEALPNDSNKAWIDRVLAKRCAHIAVDEIISITDPAFEFLGAQPPDSIYWHQVKEEINKL